MISISPADASATPSSLAWLKSILVQPFWCRLTQVYPRKEAVKRVSVSLTHSILKPFVGNEALYLYFICIVHCICIVFCNSVRMSYWNKRLLTYLLLFRRNLIACPTFSPSAFSVNAFDRPQQVYIVAQLCFQWVIDGLQHGLQSLCEWNDP